MQLASIIVALALSGAGAPPQTEFTLVDTRKDRHCHNDRGRFAVCFKKDPREPLTPNTARFSGSGEHRRAHPHSRQHPHHDK